MTDDDFKKKLQAAAEAYGGEQTEEAIFNNVLVPVAGEYGITATFEEFKEFMSSLEDAEMSNDEIAQVAGGGKGFGATFCYYVGICGGTSSGCVVIGGGQLSACAGEGVTDRFDDL